MPMPFVLCLLSGAAALQPAVSPRCAAGSLSMSAAPGPRALSRRESLASLAAAALTAGLPAAAFADDAAFKLRKDYPTDAKLMLDNMCAAVPPALSIHPPSLPVARAHALAVHGRPLSLCSRAHSNRAGASRPSCSAATRRWRGS